MFTRKLITEDSIKSCFRLTKLSMMRKVWVLVVVEDKRRSHYNLWKVLA